MYIIGINAGYSIIVVVWSLIFVSSWAAREHKMAFQWGQLDYEMTENKLQGFYGNQRRSPTDDNLHELHYPICRRIAKTTFSGFISLLILAALIVVVVMLLIFRNWIIQTKWGDSLNEYLILLPSNNLI